MEDPNSAHYTRRNDGVTADALYAVSRLVDITRKDLNDIEKILLMGTSTEKPLTGRVGRLEEKLEMLIHSLEMLEKELAANLILTQEADSNADDRIKKLERMSYMVTGALILIGTIIGYALQVLKVS